MAMIVNHWGILWYNVQNIKITNSEEASLSSERSIFFPDVKQDSRVSALYEISDCVRRDAFETIRHAKTGHIGGSSSSVELLTSLYFGGEFRFDVDNPDNPDRDIVLIRGHEGPVRYPIFSMMGYMPKEELKTYRSYGSRLQGHEDMRLAPGVDITPSGSLGMLLSYGVGAACEAISAGSDKKVIVFLGDGEEQEGNVSEAARHAASVSLNNLICIIDKNQKQLSRPTKDVDSTANLKNIWEGYGWDVVEIPDGHNIEAILRVYHDLQTINRPTCVIASTTKGMGIEGAEDHYSGYHTYGVTDHDLLDKAIENLNCRIKTDYDEPRIYTEARGLVQTPPRSDILGDTGSEAYRLFYDGDETLDLDDGRERFYRELGQRIIAISGTAPLYMISPDFVKKPSENRMRYDDYARLYHVGIREQHAVAMAHGISAMNPDARILLHYWDSFAFRAMDQMNAAAQGGVNMLIAGANAGLYQERNGGTHQSSGQPGGLHSIPGLTMYEPADTHDLYNVFSHALVRNSGVTYVRLHAQVTRPMEYDEKDRRNINSYVTYRPNKEPTVAIAASGGMVQNSIDAAKLLEAEYGVAANVLNIINQEQPENALTDGVIDGGPLLTVYNGNPRLLQSSISGAILGQTDSKRPSIIHGIGFEHGTTGNIQELERHFGLDAKHIALTALKLLYDSK